MKSYITFIEGLLFGFTKGVYLIGPFLFFVASHYGSVQSMLISGFLTIIAGIEVLRKEMK